MSISPFFLMNPDGVVVQINDDACSITGVPRNSFEGTPFVEHLLVNHQVRFESELNSLNEREEAHGLVHCTVLGLDGIGRRLTARLHRKEDDSIHVDLSSNLRRNKPREFATPSLADAERFVPVARRISTICRRSASRDDLLASGLDVLVEVTSAVSGAVVEWGGGGEGWPVNAAVGQFDETCLRGVFRSSVVSRMVRGDVIVKEPELDQGDSGASLILVPLMAAETPEGLVVLTVEGYSVLVPQEQQSLGILGEILGLGLRALEVAMSQELGPERREADVEAAIALGRLSAGLAHEISNAATVLRNNIEQGATESSHSGFGRRAVEDSAVRDSLEAVETISDLTDALSAFAPEEIRGLEEVDLLRIIDMVVASVSFYAKRGTRVTVVRPDDPVPPVSCRSHYLIRSLFLIFVELWEAALASGQELEVRLELFHVDDSVKLQMNVDSGPFGLPTILLSQLERGGLLSRHVSRAGARLEHTLDGSNLSMLIVLPCSDDENRGEITSTFSVGRSQRRGTILLVEDDEAVVRSIRRVLERDHDVLASRSGEEALKLMKGNPSLDLVLVDAYMPGMNGPSLREEVARHDPSMSRRIAFLAGGATDPKVSRYFASNDCTVLEKPIDIVRLKKLIAQRIR